MPGEFRKRELIGNLFVVTHRIDDSSDGCRADQFLKNQYHHFSRNHIQQMIDIGRIEIHSAAGSKRLKASTTLRAGDELRVITEKSEEPVVDLNYKTLFEDEHLLIIDKPGNLPVHPAGKFLFNTLLMNLRDKFKREFHLIHRLDRETSGVLLLAKNSAVTASLVKQFRERKTEKRYFAITHGQISKDEFEVDADLGSDRNSVVRLKMAAFSKGQGELDALTRFKVLKRTPNFTLVECELMTGRQHQIRVHLEHIGHPVVGDKLYGTNDEEFLDFIKTRPAQTHHAIQRHALHSCYLKFFHEPENRWLEINCPLPEDMKALLSQDIL